MKVGMRFEISSGSEKFFELVEVFKDARWLETSLNVLDCLKNKSGTLLMHDCVVTFEGSVGGIFSL
jgi:hypothetical protein